MTDPRWPHDSRRSEGPWPPQETRRGGGKGSALAISVVTGVAVLLLGAGLIGLFGTHTAPLSGATVETASPTPEITEEATSTETSATSSSTSAPSSTSDTPSARSASASAAGPRVGAVTALADNPINAVGLTTADTTCDLPRFNSSPDGQEAFYEATLSCLNAAWEPVLRSANLPFHSPKVATVTREVQTPCGTRSPTQTALYCNGTVYMTGAYYRNIEGHGDAAGVYFGQFAHEYGHHIQDLAGIMDASWQQRYNAGPDSPAGYEVSRRFELQATCYGGMFLASVAGRGSVDSKLVDEALADAGQRGDYQDGRPPDHGKPERNADWVRTGYEQNRTYQCNTWLADPETVS